MDGPTNVLLHHPTPKGGVVIYFKTQAPFTTTHLLVDGLLISGVHALDGGSELLNVLDSLENTLAAVAALVLITELTRLSREDVSKVCGITYHLIFTWLSHSSHYGAQMAFSQLA